MKCKMVVWTHATINRQIDGEICGPSTVLNECNSIPEYVIKPIHNKIIVETNAVK